MTAAQVTALLLGLALIIVLARVLGAVAKRLDQPPVIGEILAGILLGPTLFDGAITNTLFPADTRGYLASLANLGVAVFMFVVGLELDRKLLRGNGKIATSVSVGSILLPFGLGAALALYLYANHPGPNKLSFVLFMGAAMSVTAFPVLARIIADRGMQRTVLGGLALTCAAVDDVLAWSLLAGVIAVAGAGGAEQWRLFLLIPYLMVMLWVVRPLFTRMLTKMKDKPLSAESMTAVVAGLLASAAATEWIGLHYIFGAFLFGVVLPKEGYENLRTEMVSKVNGFSGVVLLPVFFITVGFKVNLANLGSAGAVELLLVLAVAIVGKFVGAFTAARLNRVPSRTAAALATLMNTRGLTELIILSVGLQLKVIDERLYSIMVVMAVVTTVMAGPLLRVFYPRKQVELDRVEVASRSAVAVS
nr:cation:proton antiporter [Kibdelosporangium sp. MJ126-NF4]CEL19979.1 Na+/H+ antiporter [Kibdelosporangium sp. MJ126-NF4]CTQ97203.1 Na+/H+ antiporter [Kibdelosporangium sp. MJ126-NF4]